MTGSQRTLLIVMVAPVLAGSAFAFHESVERNLRHLGIQAPQRQLIDQPASWVPFSAGFRRIHERDGSLIVGRDYRASDGSTRNESGPSLDAINSIAIKNVPQATFYRWIDQRGWTSQPMTLPPWGWRPVPVTWSDQITRVADTVEGFGLLRFESRDRVFYQAPQLNLFTLVTLVKCEFDPGASCGTWYSNIQIAEQPAEYFSPPLDAQIIALSEPGGIVERLPPRR
jgi:hypothetical protein